MMLRWNAENWITIGLMAAVWYFAAIAVLSLVGGSADDDGSGAEDSGAVA